MKILHLTPRLIPILSTFPVFIPDNSNKKKKEVDDNNKSMNCCLVHVVEDSSISLYGKINGEIKPLMMIITGISKRENYYDSKTRCGIITSGLVASFTTGAFIMGVKNGYPVLCAAENTCNVVNVTTLNQQLSIGFNMIQNEHQYKVSQGKIREIEQHLDQLYKEKNSLHPRQFKMRENGLQGILLEIQEEIEKYDALKEKPTFIEIESFAEIPVALIKARIASGMTQKDLADKLGMKEQQIQRYEANQYGSAGFHRLTEVAEALEVTLNSSLLTLRR
jgi:HTH-type transcriptional regulator / antitoxin HipB